MTAERFPRITILAAHYRQAELVADTELLARHQWTFANSGRDIRGIPLDDIIVAEPALTFAHDYMGARRWVEYQEQLTKTTVKRVWT